MKTIQHTLKLAMITFILVFVSCSKDEIPADDTSMAEPTAQELLMTGKWYMHSNSLSGIYNECERQTYIEFVDEDSLVIHSFSENGTLVCESLGIRVLGYYMIGEDQFQVDDDSDDPFHIDFVSETQLILRQTSGTESYTIHLRK